MASTIGSGESTGANHDDHRVSRRYCAGRFDLMGRAGAVDAGKLSDANWPYCGRNDSKLFALLPRNLAANLDWTSTRRAGR